MLTNPDAETAFLGALLAFPEYAPRVSTVTSAMFTLPRNIVLMDAVQDAAQAEQIPDRITVLDILRRNGALSRDDGLGVYLAALASFEVTPQPMNLTWYATQIIDAYRRREITKVANRIIDAAKTSTADELGQFAPALVDSIHEMTAPVDDSDKPIKGLYELGEFVDQETKAPEWLIPGLLTRGDRVIVVASEGAGKSMLARAVAVALASGRHPFVPSVRIPKRRTLLADLENPAHIIAEKTGSMVGFMRGRNLWTDGWAHILHRPGGLDLRKPTDQRMLELAVERTRPDLLCLGPVYKTFTAGGDREEVAAREVAVYFDRLRERFGCAIWLEHHAPMEQSGSRMIRPVGTGLWLRWPEFGIGLTKQDDEFGAYLEVGHWRDGRDEREWPKRLYRGTDGWAWSAFWEDQPTWFAAHGGDETKIRSVSA